VAVMMAGEALLQQVVVTVQRAVGLVAQAVAGLAVAGCCCNTGCAELLAGVVAAEEKCLQLVGCSFYRVLDSKYPQSV